jgi:protein phosphatase PTC1
MGESGFFAVFDGHGGKDAADFSSTKLHELLEIELKSHDESSRSMRQCFETSYAKTDELLKGRADFMGTTAVTCFLQSRGPLTRLYAANAGDARAVLCRDGKALRVTCDHKPSLESERQRLVECGAFVARNRVNAVLAVSRALGDHALKKFVISEPNFWEGELGPTDSFLLIACDGLWDVVQDQEAIDLVTNNVSAKEMADTLVNEALKKGSTDNISVMAVRFCWESRFASLGV